MNTRIRELAFQAMSINQTVSDDAFFVEVSKLNEFEKFAELIVEECLMKAIGAKIRGESIDILIQNIIEDFGVK
jgi:hypothetical protein